MSSLYILATGTLIADPQRREGTKGLFATGAIRVEAGEPTPAISGNSERSLT